MDDERIERLLRGYRLPDVSGDLDHRVLSEGAAIMARARAWAAMEDVGRTLLDRFGFGPLAWLIDLVTKTDAEYRVAFL
jgi:hypothetical protein